MINALTLTRYFYTPEERPEALLVQQLEAAEEYVRGLVMLPLLYHQLEALTCLVSDVHAGLAEAPSSGIPDSFLIIAINKGMWQVAAGEFHVFCYVQGKLNNRAWQKRQAEQYLFVRNQMLFQ